jgi:hypothetical protein
MGGNTSPPPNASTRSSNRNGPRVEEVD